MTDSEGSSATSRRRHILRLALFAAFLLGLFYLVAVTRIVEVEDLRRTVAATGARATDLRRRVRRARRRFRTRPDSGRYQRPAVRARSRRVRDPGRVGRNGDHHQPHRRRAGRQSARALSGRGTCRPSRSNDRTARAVGGRRSAVHPGHFGCARLLCVRGVWSSVVADGRRSVHRLGAAAFVYTALGASIGDLSSPLAYAAIAVWA